MAQERMQNNESRINAPKNDSILTTPGVSQVLARTNISLDKVRVIHGANEQYFDNLSGKNVEKVRKSLREVFNIPSDAVALVDGKPVQGDFVLQGGQNLEFHKEAGVKGLSKNSVSNFYFWASLVFCALVLMGVFKTLSSIFFLHPIHATIYGVLTVFWGFLFKSFVEKFNETEQLNDH